MRAAVLLAVASGLVLAGCGSSGSSGTVAHDTVASSTSTHPTTSSTRSSTSTSTSSSTSSSSTPTGTSTSTSTTSTTTTTTTVAGTTGLPGNPAGALPQTDVLPSSSDPQFTQEMKDLWAGVQSGNFVTAMPAFFPLQAYEQVKAIPDPESDWRWRLVAEFELDLEAAHRYLGSGASQDKLLYVAVPEEQAWIPPGYCYNSTGYWHDPGARIVYSSGGQEYSIGIASLISWRGEWYVVHLGAVLRSNDSAGIVDDPTSGQGPFGPPGGC